MKRLGASYVRECVCSNYNVPSSEYGWCVLLAVVTLRMSQRLTDSIQTSIERLSLAAGSAQSWLVFFCSVDTTTTLKCFSDRGEQKLSNKNEKKKNVKDELLERRNKITGWKKSKQIMTLHKPIDEIEIFRIASVCVSLCIGAIFSSTLLLSSAAILYI